MVVHRFVTLIGQPVQAFRVEEQSTLLGQPVRAFREEISTPPTPNQHALRQEDISTHRHPALHARRHEEFSTHARRRQPPEEELVLERRPPDGASKERKGQWTSYASASRGCGMPCQHCCLPAHRPGQCCYALNYSAEAVNNAIAGWLNQS